MTAKSMRLIVRWRSMMNKVENHQIMTVIPISNLSQTEIHMLATNAILTVCCDGEIDAVNRSLSIHGEQIESLIDLKPAELLAAVA
jgi:hypothetical protein